MVGADGIWSPVARAAGAATDVDYQSLTCGYYAYWPEYPLECVEFYVRHGRDILVFPTHDGLTCIWAGRSRDDWDMYRKDVEGYLPRHNWARSIAYRAAQLLAAGVSFKGTSKLLNFYRQSFGKGWALVGDAAYHRDPLPGMGISDAFFGARLLADALADGLADDPARLDYLLAAYQSAFRDKTMPIFEYTLKAANLKDPASAVPIYERIAQSHEERHVLWTSSKEISLQRVLRPTKHHGITFVAGANDVSVLIIVALVMIGSTCIRLIR